MPTSLFIIYLAAACKPAPAPATPVAHLQPGPPAALEPAEAVAAADLDGDGSDEVIRFREGSARWDDQSVALSGVVQAVARGDVDGDGLEEVIVATGVGRGDRESPVRIWALGSEGATQLWERKGERDQVTDLAILPGEEGQPDRLFVAVFADKRNVQGGFLVDGELQEQLRVEMGLRMQPLTDGSVLVGRLYGDQPKSPGDLARFTADGSRQPLTSHRGVRALAASDLDGDGLAEWLVGDGWHYAYGEHADPDLRLFPGSETLSQAPPSSRVIGRLDGSYAVEELEVATPPGGSDPVILATGSHGAYLLERDDLGWRIQRLADLSETDNAVFLHQEGALAVLLSGRPARVLPLRRPQP